MNSFCEKTHCYKINGQPVPSVTSVLKEAGLIDTSWYTPDATQRGSFVHEACALYDRDELDMDELDPRLIGYVLAWSRFRKESGIVPTIIEQQYYSEQYGYAGTLDRAWVDGKYWVVCEIKSGPLPKWLPLQLAGYAILVGEYASKGLGVQLKANGTYSVKLIKTPELFKARRMFLEILARVKKNRSIINGMPTMSSKSWSTQ